MNTQDLLKLPGVVGFGHGTKSTGGRDTGKAAIRVYVKKKLPLALISSSGVVPPTVRDGEADIITDVVEVGDVRALQDNKSKFRPVIGGISISPGLFHLAGTGGLVVERYGMPMLLTNNHVCRMSFLTDPAARPQKGEYIRQPAYTDNGKVSDSIGVLEDYVEMSFPGPNEVDCALVKIKVDSLPIIAGLDVPAGITSPVKGHAVSKSGRTSGITTGTVTDTDVTIQVNYSNNPAAPIMATMTGQILTTPMMQPGDSGSVMLDGDKVVALGFAGSDQVSIATPIIKVMDALRINIPLAHDTREIALYLTGKFIIWGFNAPAQKWLCYDPNYPGSDLLCLVAGLGYWLQTDTEQILQHHGISWALSRGWNNIGWR